MNNYERWCSFTSNLPSPQSYIDFGFYWMISAALERRVWYYDDITGGSPLFVNLYIVPVGPPAVGKGLVAGRLANFLSYHKNTRSGQVQTSAGMEYPPLFTLGGDSMTFEGMLANLSKSTRAMPVTNKPDYIYCSMSFVLEELSSLFKRKTEDVPKLLLNLYDCKDYNYITKHGTPDRIRRPSASMFACTQAKTLTEAYRLGIFTDGFTSRTIFIFEDSTRFDKFHLSGLSPEQIEHGNHIIAWLKQLATAYGQLTYDEHTANWLEEWYQEKVVKRRTRFGEKLLSYIDRKRVHLLKLAAAVHFSDYVSRIIPLSAFQRADELLESIEPQMAAGFNSTGRNELHPYTNKMRKLISAARRPVSKAELVANFAVDLSLEEIETCIKELELQCKLKTTIDTKGVIHYKL